MDTKWILLIALEALAWLFTVGFIVLRYWFRLERASIVALVAMIVDTFGIVALGIYYWAKTGEVSTYQFLIAGLIIYAVTIGREDARRLDRWLGAKISRRRARYETRRLRTRDATGDC
jgi:hypothetical protein